MAPTTETPATATPEQVSIVEPRDDQMTGLDQRKKRALSDESNTVSPTTNGVQAPFRRVCSVVFRVCGEAPITRTP
ncbi:MAG: hypothetical protein VX589_05705 [Myxococcota bacterium]|nr:hypothetical protein [Myxococcota bacterium]